MHEAPVPHVIFFDPFSQRTDTDAWTFEGFKQIFEICKDGSTELFTYSSSTAVRALLLGAGFFVAKGRSTGPRSETTIAFTRKALVDEAFPYPVLTTQWLTRWERSQVKFPESVSVSYHPTFEQAIRSHPQFLDSDLSPR